MRLHRPVGLPLMSVILGSVGGSSKAADPAAESELLKEKGLTKSASTFVVEAEKPVLAKMKDVRGVFAN